MERKEKLKRQIRRSVSKLLVAVMIITSFIGYVPETEGSLLGDVIKELSPEAISSGKVEAASKNDEWYIYNVKSNGHSEPYGRSVIGGVAYDDWVHAYNESDKKHLLNIASSKNAFVFDIETYGGRNGAVTAIMRGRDKYHLETLKSGKWNWVISGYAKPNVVVNGSISESEHHRGNDITEEPYDGYRIFSYVANTGEGMYDRIGFRGGRITRNDGDLLYLQGSGGNIDKLIEQFSGGDLNNVFLICYFTDKNAAPHGEGYDGEVLTPGFVTRDCGLYEFGYGVNAHWVYVDENFNPIKDALGNNLNTNNGVILYDFNADGHPVDVLRYHSSFCAAQTKTSGNKMHLCNHMDISSVQAHQYNGHFDLVSGQEDKYHYRTCTTTGCGHVEIQEHVWEEVRDLNDGVHHYVRCKYCGYQKNEEHKSVEWHDDENDSKMSSYSEPYLLYNGQSLPGPWTITRSGDGTHRGRCYVCHSTNCTKKGHGAPENHRWVVDSDTTDKDGHRVITWRCDGSDSTPNAGCGAIRRTATTNGQPKDCKIYYSCSNGDYGANDSVQVTVKGGSTQNLRGALNNVAGYSQNVFNDSFKPHVNSETAGGKILLGYRIPELYGNTLKTEGEIPTSTVVNQNIHVIAVFKDSGGDDEVTITINANGGYMSGLPNGHGWTYRWRESGSIAYVKMPKGTVYSVTPTATLSGSTCQGWAKNNPKASSGISGTIRNQIADADTTWYATWDTPTTYRITFDAMNGSFPSAKVNEAKYYGWQKSGDRLYKDFYYGATFSFPWTPKYDDGTFSGWSPSFTGSATVYGNKTYRAQYGPPANHVEYNANGGEFNKDTYHDLDYVNEAGYANTPAQHGWDANGITDWSDNRTPAIYKVQNKLFVRQSSDPDTSTTDYMWTNNSSERATFSPDIDFAYTVNSNSRSNVNDVRYWYRHTDSSTGRHYVNTISSGADIGQAYPMSARGGSTFDLARSYGLRYHEIQYGGDDGYGPSTIITKWTNEVTGTYGWYWEEPEYGSYRFRGWSDKQYSVFNYDKDADAVVTQRNGENARGFKTWYAVWSRGYTPPQPTRFMWYDHDGTLLKSELVPYGERAYAPTITDVLGNHPSGKEYTIPSSFTRTSGSYGSSSVPIGDYTTSNNSSSYEQTVKYKINCNLKTYTYTFVYVDADNNTIDTKYINNLSAGSSFSTSSIPSSIKNRTAPTGQEIDTTKSNTWYPAITTHTVSGDKTFTRYYRWKYYDIDFYTSSGSTKIISTQKIRHGSEFREPTLDEIKAKETIPESKTRKGWTRVSGNSNSGTLNSKGEFTSYVATSNASFKLTLGDKPKVTFIDARGGTQTIGSKSYPQPDYHGDVLKASVYYDDNAIISYPESTPNHEDDYYTFVGWYRVAENRIYNHGEIAKTIANTDSYLDDVFVAVYKKWAKITYKDADGTGTPVQPNFNGEVLREQNAPENELLDFPPEPYHEGYTFLYWDSSISDSRDYTPGGTVPKATDKDETYIAHYAKNPEIIFKESSEFGDIEISRTDYHFDEDIVNPADPMHRDIHREIDYWESDRGRKIIPTEGTVLKTPVASDGTNGYVETFTAHYKWMTYWIVFEDNDGSGNWSTITETEYPYANGSTYQTQTPVTFAVPDKSVTQHPDWFSGWSPEVPQPPYVNTAVDQYAVGNVVTFQVQLDYDRYFCDIWFIDEFPNADGSPYVYSHDDMVEVGSDIVQPTLAQLEARRREGYTFKGWSPSVPQKATTSYVFVAMWNPPSDKYNDDDVTPPTDPTKDPDRNPNPVPDSDLDEYHEGFDVPSALIVHEHQPYWYQSNGVKNRFTKRGTGYGTHRYKCKATTTTYNYIQHYKLIDGKIQADGDRRIWTEHPYTYAEGTCPWYHDEPHKWKAKPTFSEYLEGWQENYNPHYDGYLMDECEICAEQLGGYGVSFSQDFSYTGGIQSVTLQPGRYTLEVWGAQGGKSIHGIRGGLGGYATGDIIIGKATKVYIAVGGAGGIAQGGFNGGGNGSTKNSDSAAGGGATHIATSDGVLSSLASDKESVWIVAGGGGGSGCSSSIAGNGGGESGTRGSDPYYGPQGWPGTQTAGGQGGNNSQSGSFGKGGNTGTSYDWPGGGGGGGWYGGGAGSNLSGGGSSGAGGSGYVGNLKNASMQTGVRNGNGFARIYGSGYVPNNPELRRRYREIHYGIIFDPNLGIGGKEDAYSYFDDIVVPEYATRDGYIPLRWQLIQGGTETMKANAETDPLKTSGEYTTFKPGDKIAKPVSTSGFKMIVAQVWKHDHPVMGATDFYLTENANVSKTDTPALVGGDFGYYVNTNVKTNYDLHGAFALLENPVWYKFTGYELKEVDTGRVVKDTSQKTNATLSDASNYTGNAKTATQKSGFYTSVASNVNELFPKQTTTHEFNFDLENTDAHIYQATAHAKCSWNDKWHFLRDNGSYDQHEQTISSNKISIMGDCDAPDGLNEYKPEGLKALEDIIALDLGEVNNYPTPGKYEVPLVSRDEIAYFSGLDTDASYIKVHNKDNGKEYTLKPTLIKDTYGRYRMEFEKMDVTKYDYFPSVPNLFNGDFIIDYYLKDKVGNYTTSNNTLTSTFNMTVTDWYSQTYHPNDNYTTIGDETMLSLKKGEAVHAKIRTRGYANCIEIKFPSDWYISEEYPLYMYWGDLSDYDPSKLEEVTENVFYINPDNDINGDWIQDFIFITPLYAESKVNEIEFIGYKGDIYAIDNYRIKINKNASSEIEKLTRTKKCYTDGTKSVTDDLHSHIEKTY